MEHKKENFFTRNNLGTPLAIVIAGALIAVAIFYKDGTPVNAPAVGAQKAPTAKVAVDASKVKTSGEPYIGKTSAPLTVAIWTDFQCPFCKKFELDTVRHWQSPHNLQGFCVSR
jgi:protein-disulfide isomerase